MSPKKRTAAPHTFEKVGIPDVSKLPPKEQVMQLGKSEGGRAIGEMAKSSVMDLALDALQMWAGAGGANAPVALLIEAVEMKFEHGVVAAQDKEHISNMKVLLAASRQMYEDALEKADANGWDKKELTKNLKRLEYMSVLYHGDVKQIKAFKNAWGWVTKGVNKVVAAGQSKVGKWVETALLEGADIVPGLAPETVSEMLRMGNLLAFLKLYNAHPEVTDAEKVHVNKEMLVEAIRIQKLRMSGMLKKMIFA